MIPPETPSIARFLKKWSLPCLSSYQTAVIKWIKVVTSPLADIHVIKVRMLDQNQDAVIAEIDDSDLHNPSSIENLKPQRYQQKIGRQRPDC